jgi:hypothetical protein
MSVQGRQPLFVPTQLGGLVLWLRADQGVTCVAGNQVSQWNDMSGLGNNVTQGTGAQQLTAGC